MFAIYYTRKISGHVADGRTNKWRVPIVIYTDKKKPGGVVFCAACLPKALSLRISGKARARSRAETRYAPPYHAAYTCRNSNTIILWSYPYTWWYTGWLRYTLLVYSNPFFRPSPFIAPHCTMRTVSKNAVTRLTGPRPPRPLYFNTVFTVRTICAPEGGRPERLDRPIDRLMTAATPRWLSGARCACVCTYDASLTYKYTLGRRCQHG